MKKSWSDPYLWVHVAGAATLPLWLFACLLGLAAGDPILPMGVEAFLVAVLGAAPVVWMQLKRPYSLYSLLAVTLKLEKLSEDQLRVLTWLKAGNPLVVAGAAALLCLVLKLISDGTAIAAASTPIPNHFLGLIVAIVAFLGANLFLQVPLSALQVLLKSDAVFGAIDPYANGRILSDFTVLGIKIDKILPELESDPVRI
ncbi:MAG: low-complexity tail membrane protein [Alkalinema sp. RU_4_3]|nr:low-complexity tail membrane protein [Alkalinema sp. RU_4_3]